MPTEKPRYTVIVDEELLKKIDDFRFENRYPSRSAATLELIRLGMEALKKEQEEGKQFPFFCIFIDSYSLGTQFRKGSNKFAIS